MEILKPKPKKILTFDGKDMHTCAKCFVRFKKSLADEAAIKEFQERCEERGSYPSDIALVCSACYEKYYKDNLAHALS